MSSWVELRVHGVSGTPPESLLGSAHVCQVAGDDRSRSFRPTDAQGNEVPTPDGHLLEAFHWGRWTSGSWMQALWILLIPFGIANAAQFMLPGPSGGGRARTFHALSGMMLRLLALALTLLFAVLASVVVIDLVAWQWLAGVRLPGDDRVIVVPAVLVAAGVVYLLSFLGRVAAGRRRYGVAAEPEELPGLSDTAFFDGDPDNPSLRYLHLAAALFLVGWVAVSAVATSHPPLTGLLRWVVLGLLVGTVAVVALLGDPERTTTVQAGTGDLRRRWHGIGSDGQVLDDDPPSQRVARWLHWLGVVAVLAAAVAVGAAPVRRGALPGVGGHLPGMDGTTAAVGIAGAAALFLLFWVVLGLARATRAADPEIPAPFRRFAAGMTAWLAAAVGFFLGIGLTAGLALTVQGLINRLQKTSGAVVAPEVLQRVSFTWGVTAVVALLLGLLAWRRMRRRRDQFETAAAAAYTFGDGPPENLEPRLPQEWLRRVARAMGVARLKNHLQLVFWVFAALGTVLALAAAGDYLVTRHLPVVEWLTGVNSPPGQPVSGDDIVIGVGQVVLLGLAAGAVLLARGAIRAEGPRRALNVVWDVIAFWPRSVHPFVPPPYAQEVVPALVRRICWHLGEPDPFPDPPGPDEAGRRPHVSAAAVNREPAQTVVVAAHSQGSLISLAALLQLPPHLRPQVRWLTFGSQLRQQFPRAFPHYVRVADLADVAERHNWLSLYRDTDPIGGPVTSWRHRCTVDQNGLTWSSCRLLPPRGPVTDRIDPVSGRRECGREWRLLDPPATDWRFHTSAVATIQGHSNYWLDPDWHAALMAVLHLCDAPGEPPSTLVATAQQ